MGKRKVIEDSDDEDGDETTPLSQGAFRVDAGTSIDLQESQEQQDVQKSTNPSTGSTEVLNREMRAAHQSLIDPTPEGSLPGPDKVVASQRQSQPSPTTSRTQLKRATTTVETRPRARKSLKKYGTESSKSIFDFARDVDEDFTCSTGKSHGQRSMGSTGAFSSGDTVALDSSELLKIGSTPGSGRTPGKDAMLPPTTNPTSLEQTQSSETSIRADNQDVRTTKTLISNQNSRKPLDSAGLRHCHSGMATSSRYSDRSDGEHSHEPDGLRDPSRSTGLKVGTTSFDTVGPSSSASVCSLNRTIEVDRKEQAFPVPPTDDPSIENGAPNLLATHHIPETINPVVLLPDIHHAFTERDELSLPTHGPETWSINQTSFSNAQKRKRQKDSEPIDEPSSEDVAIGLPKDQYQPRPSKSRSGRATDEVIIPIDFSKRPEALAKKKKTESKRRKTTALHELTRKSAKTESDEDSANNLSVKAAEVIHLPNHIQEPDGVKSNTERVANRDAGAIEVGESAQVVITEGQYQSTESVEEPMVTKKQRGRPKKEAAAKMEGETTASASDVKSNQVFIESSNSMEGHPAKTVKKGRKANLAPVAMSKELIHDSEDELEDVDDMIGAPRKHLKETTKTSNVPVPTETTASMSPIKAVTPAPQTPRKTAPPAEKGPDKHSPISSGNVAYRVGLSKRARIAPLLRIVRKT